MKRKICTWLTAIMLAAALAVPAAAISPMEQAACDLVNAHRISAGLEPLEISQSLSDMARIKSRDMRDNRYFSHTSPTYGSPFTMMRNLGISYGSAGENIAMGFSTAQAVAAAWMNSPTHRANILSEKYDTMGIGHLDGYWTNWFIS